MGQIDIKLCRIYTVDVEADMVQDARIKWIDRPRRLHTWETTDAALVISSSDDKNTLVFIMKMLTREIKFSSCKS